MMNTMEISQPSKTEKSTLWFTDDGWKTLAHKKLERVFNIDIERGDLLREC